MGFSQNVHSEEDDLFSKLKDSLDQLQQHHKDFFPEDFNSDGLLTVDDNVTVEGGMRQTRQNETDESEEEEEREDGDNEN